MKKILLIAIVLASVCQGSQVFRSSKFAAASSAVPVSYTFDIVGSGAQPIPAGAASVRIRVYGSGGGGARASSDLGGGGGGGGFSDKTYTIAVGDAAKSVPWMVGAGGTGKTGSSGNGNVGQPTTSGSAIFTLNSVSVNQSGGAGSGGTTTAGGAGGTGTGGSTNHTGTAGGSLGDGTGGAAADSGPGAGGDGAQSPVNAFNGNSGMVVMDFS